MKMKLKAPSIITYNMAIGFVGLFVVLILGMILTISMLNDIDDAATHLQQKLDFLEKSQWSLLFLGVLLTAYTVFWWYKRESYSRNLNQELYSIISAISESQAILELDMDGKILAANENLLEMTNYTLDDLLEKHHSIFVDDATRTSQEYKDFWKTLNRGEYIQREFRRVGNNGKELWLQASYNPILNTKGKPVKILKVASDITLRKLNDIQLAQLTEKLQQVGKQIMADSNEVSVGINQLEATAVSQAASAAEQATSVTEISATIEEIKATSQQTLAKAKELGDSATRTSQEGEKGQAAINEMGNSMMVLQNKMQEISNTILGLNDKTQQISEITEAVADIAKQSKMLALNASIEAAKAGESGKGFAVVAGEVKELAEKSQLSTERVQKILQNIRHTAEQAVMVTEAGTKSVEENIHQVQLAGTIIGSLGKVIEESSLASLQIVSAVREESIAIDQVDLSIKEINKVTHQFSAASEQTKQAIIGLSRVAESLKKTASVYQEQQQK